MPYALALVPLVASATSEHRRGLSRDVARRARGSVGVARGASSDTTSAETSGRAFIVYTKPGCCLCDGLFEKLDAVTSAREATSAADASDALRGFVVVKRDVSTNAEWADAYADVVPMLFVRDDDGVEREVRRPTPKTSAARLGADLDAFVRRHRRATSGQPASPSWVVVSAPPDLGGMPRQ